MSLLNTLILASGSPRRKQLLTWAGLQFKIYVPEVDESLHRNEKPRTYVKRIARSKAQKIFSTGKIINGFILAADTTVVAPNGRILGKPRTPREGYKMLSLISGKTHQVITGVCILQIQNGKLIKRLLSAYSTSVTMRNLARREIQTYLKTGEYKDKAGAYAAQGHGMCIIHEIRGSYTNVVGLPVTETLYQLKKLGFRFS